MNNILETTKSVKDRFQLWTEFIKKESCFDLCEIGVYKGDFAKLILEECPSITKYYMIDPWRNLTDWNKPANKDDKEFEQYYQETIAKTAFAKEKIQVLRGKTTEVSKTINDESLDFVYIDGDHTLKGITVDLLSIWPKIKPNGFIAGDDFCPSIWQHSEEFEPTLVFPFAVYFAEAMNVKIYALPYNQFLIKKEQSGFQFIDLTNGRYKFNNLIDHVKRKEKGIANQNIIHKIRKKLS